MTAPAPADPERADGPAGRTWRLGLIGGNIVASRSPVLHAVCALSVGGNASYDLLIPAEHDRSFATMLEHCARSGFDGVNVTYPYKEEAARLVPPGDPVVAAMGSANTVRFAAGGPRAYNTDCTGFVAAFRAQFADRSPGRVLLLGTGGVGRAVAFGLADLGARAILLHDTDPAKVAALATALRGQYPAVTTGAAGAGAVADLSGLDGVVNCTPLGMEGRPGSALPDQVRGAPGWAFDAVYTPEHTRFRAQVERLGAAFLSGFDLYFHQGVQAFAIFTGARPDQDWVRGVITHRP
ncbi:MAG: shikimate dehydrogenase [Alphaproteobacteria bacterium HGW-Alphaproteobacteria-6]|nr:MAG: shikimate dehydrogenase [Alphaproteobacteria bacterium HGW-Alphaproteobacteria-6]